MDGQFIVNIRPSKNVTAQYVEKLYEYDVYAALLNCHDLATY